MILLVLFLNLHIYFFCFDSVMQEKAKYDILSLNVRGIRDQVKRRSIFQNLKDHNSKIYFLHETYSQPEDEIIWKNEWGGEIFFSHGTKHSKGVNILLHPTVAK